MTSVRSYSTRLGHAHQLHHNCRHLGLLQRRAITATAAAGPARVVASARRRMPSGALHAGGWYWAVWSPYAMWRAVCRACAHCFFPSCCGRRRRCPSYCSAFYRIQFVYIYLDGTASLLSCDTCCTWCHADSIPTLHHFIKSRSPQVHTWTNPAGAWNPLYDAHKCNSLNRGCPSSLDTNWIYKRTCKRCIAPNSHKSHSISCSDSWTVKDTWARNRP